MTREVLLVLTGDQIDQYQESDTIELITTAEFFERNGKKYILYEEISEDTKEVTKNRIKIESQKVEVTKTGAVNVHMIFDKNKKNDSLYQTPYGTITVGIRTEKVNILESEEQIRVQIDYKMEVNSRHFADCSMKMKILSKDSAGESHIIL